MESFEELKHIWHTAAATPQHSAAGLTAKVKRHRRRLLLKGSLGVLAMTGTLLVMIWVVLSYHFNLWTTHCGVLLMMIAVLAGVVMRSRLLQMMLPVVQDTSDMHTYLLHLEKYQAQQVYIHSKGIAAYFIVLSAGLAFYLFEFAQSDLKFGLIAYSLTFGWVLFCWFYLRPRTVRKQTAGLNEMIKILSGYVHQLDALS